MDAGGHDGRVRARVAVAVAFPAEPAAPPDSERAPAAGFVLASARLASLRWMDDLPGPPGATHATRTRSPFSSFPCDGC